MLDSEIPFVCRSLIKAWFLVIPFILALFVLLALFIIYFVDWISYNNVIDEIKKLIIQIDTLEKEKDLLHYKTQKNISGDDTKKIQEVQNEIRVSESKLEKLKKEKDVYDKELQKFRYILLVATIICFILGLLVAKLQNCSYRYPDYTELIMQVPTQALRRLFDLFKRLIDHVLTRLSRLSRTQMAAPGDSTSPSRRQQV